MNILTLSDPALAAIAEAKAAAVRLPSSRWVPVEAIPAMRDTAANLRCIAAALETELYHMARAAHVAALNPTTGEAA